MKSYMTYQGTVTITTRNTTTHKHNVGSTELFNLLCRFLCGNTILDRELPYYIHLVKPSIVNSDGQVSISTVDGTTSYCYFPSIVVKTVNESSSTLELLTNINSNQYTNCATDNSEKLTLALTDQFYKILAVYTDDTITYNDLTDGFQAEVNWSLKFENKLEDSV